MAPTCSGSDVPQLERSIVTARHHAVWITEELGCQHLTTVSSQSVLQHDTTSSVWQPSCR